MLAFLYKNLNVSLVGMSIHACKRSAHHLVIYGEDLTLFDVVLFSLHDNIPTPNASGLKPKNGVSKLRTIKKK